MEAALAHAVRNQTEAADARSDMFERRRHLMEDWGSTSRRCAGSSSPCAAGDARSVWVPTHAAARSLTAVEFTPAQADAITNAVRLAAERGDLVTSDQFTAGLSEVRTEIAALDTRLSTQIANLDTRFSTQIADLRTEQRAQTAEVRTEVAAIETRLIRWMVGTVLATATLTVGIVCLFG